MEFFYPVLGDSFAFGLGVNDEETFINLLKPKSGYVLINLGVPGSCLPNHLDIVEDRHKVLGSPSLYLFVFFLGNDFIDMMKYYENLEHHGAGDEERNSLIQRSYVAQFITHLISKDSEDQKGKGRKTRMFRTPGGQRLGSSIYLLMSGSRTYRTEASKVLERTLDRLDTLSKKLQFQSVFIVIPEKHQTELGRFEKQAATYKLAPTELDRHLPNRILEGSLDKHSIPYVDVTTCLEGQSGMYYKIDDHFTAAGNQTVARCINQDSKWEKVGISNP